jgi:hypothetical protein
MPLSPERADLPTGATRRNDGRELAPVAHRFAGEVTVNQFKPDAIKGNVNNRSVNDWLVSDVCQR